MAELKEQRESEAQGTVYVVGRGYGADMSSWDRLFVRNNLTVLQALSGRGVVQLSAVRDLAPPHPKLTATDRVTGLGQYSGVCVVRERRRVELGVRAAG